MATKMMKSKVMMIHSLPEEKMVERNKPLFASTRTPRKRGLAMVVNYIEHLKEKEARLLEKLCEIRSEYKEIERLLDEKC